MWSLWEDSVSESWENSYQGLDVLKAHGITDSFRYRDIDLTPQDQDLYLIPRWLMKTEYFYHL